MPVNDLYKVVFDHRYQGVIVQNVLHFRAKTAGLTATGLGEALRFTYRDSFRFMCVGAMTLQKIDVIKMSDTSNERYSVNYFPPYAGMVGGDGAPKILAAVISLKTALRGRSKRGRWYHAGFPTSWLTAGFINSTGESNLVGYFQTFFNYFKSGGSNTSWEVGVYSKKLGGYNVPYTIAGFQAYTTFTLRSEPGTERGRKS